MEQVVDAWTLLWYSLTIMWVSALFYNWNLSEEQSQYLNLGSCRKCLSAFSSCRDKAAFIQFFCRPCISGSLIHWVNLGIAYKFKLQMSSCVFCSNVTWWSWIRVAERASPLAGVNLRMANPSLDLAIVGALNHWVANFFFVLHAYKFRMLSCVFWDPKVEVLRKFPELDARRKHHIAPCERESGVYLLVSLKHINFDCFFSVCFICSRSFPDLPCRTSTFMSYLYLNCQGRAVLTFSCLGISISSLYICIWHKV